MLRITLDPMFGVIPPDIRGNVILNVMNIPDSYNVTISSRLRYCPPASEIIDFRMVKICVASSSDPVLGIPIPEEGYRDLQNYLSSTNHENRQPLIMENQDERFRNFLSNLCGKTINLEHIQGNEKEMAKELLATPNLWKRYEDEQGEVVITDFRRWEYVQPNENAL